jgi:hypothetical protein
MKHDFWSSLIYPRKEGVGCIVTFIVGEEGRFLFSSRVLRFLADASVLG